VFCFFVLLLAVPWTILDIKWLIAEPSWKHAAYVAYDVLVTGAFVIVLAMALSGFYATPA
jgi:bacteriorhodopsin